MTDDIENIRIMIIALLLAGIPCTIIYVIFEFLDRREEKKEKAKYVDYGGDRCNVKVPIKMYPTQALFSGNIPDTGMWMFECICPACGVNFYSSSREDSICMCCMYDGRHS